MSAKSVLKAGQAFNSLSPRVVLRGRAEVVAPAVEPGIWISQAELEALKSRCIEQGWVEGEARGRRLAQEVARQQAEKDAGLRLERELKERQDRYAKEQADKWRGLAAALASQIQALREQLEAEVTEWTFAAIVRLLGQRTPEDVLAAVRIVLAESRLEGPLTVLLHAQDLANVSAGGPSDANEWPDGLKFAADARVGIGGCLIQSSVQTLDARLEVQLDLLRKTLDNLRLERAAIEG